MWERDEDLLALLELIEVGILRRRAGQEHAWKLLDELPWTRRTGRRDEIELLPERRPDLLELITRVWPAWQAEGEKLRARGLAATPSDWRRMQDLLRAEAVAELPARLNRRTATSAVAPHSKSTLSSMRRMALGETELTHDGIVRMRPPPGLRTVRGGLAFDAVEIASVLGEVAITERALIDGTVLEGRARAVLLVENLGPYQDIDAPEGWLIVHVPGWNTATVRLILDQVPHVPVVLFGDLDPAGVRIARHLQKLRPDLRWAVPDFWREYVDRRGLPGNWPDDLSLDRAPLLVRELAARSLWLEQELIALDARLPAALQSIADA
jgi:hypothetical protein